jgi:amino acid adenylation domain-containing protein
MHQTDNPASPTGGTVIHLFIEQQATRTPQSVAVMDDVSSMTYAAFHSRTNQIAHYLQTVGVGPEVRVAILMKRSLQLLCTIVGVLKAGGAYVPLDLRYPEERLELMVNDSGATILLTDSSVVPSFVGTGLQCVDLNSEGEAIARQSDLTPRASVQAHNLAYILFTSGSTGRPKGVAIEHQAAAAFIQWAQSYFTSEELAGTLLGTSMCFDLSIFELFVPLSCGAKVILAENLLALPTMKAASQVTLINTVPSVMQELLQSGPLPSSVTTVNLAGEPLPRALVAALYERTGVKKVYNLYGPTESTTYATAAFIERGGPITIGRPIQGTQVYVLDAGLSPVENGVEGDLFIGGAGLARGYIGKPDLTAAAFILNPNARDGEESRMYRTGDRARVLADGSLEFLGRSDRQIKLLGFRIEPGEIESMLDRHEGIARSVVVLRKGPGGHELLVAYYVPKRGAVHESAELLLYLRGVVPSHLVPGAMVRMETFPLTANGKIDVGGLPAPTVTVASDPAESARPRSGLEENLMKIWNEVLGVGSIGIHDDFFGLGGNSLQINRVASRLKSQLGITLNMAELFDLSTIAAIADHVTSHSLALSPVASEPLAVSPEAIPEFSPFTATVAGATSLQLNGQLDPSPLSFFEEMLWSWAQYDPRVQSYNSHLFLSFQGDLNVRALEESIASIVQRQEILRATYKVKDGRLVRCISPDTVTDLVRIDMTAPSDPAVRWSQALQFCTDESKLPFDLENGPLFRTKLISLDEGLHVFALTAHHIIFDGWSMQLFARELSTFYAHATGGAAHDLQPLAFQYSDYARWQRAALDDAALARLASFWIEELAGFNLILLPTDGRRGRTMEISTEVMEFTIPPEISARLTQVSRQLLATPFMVLLTVLDIVLLHLTTVTDVSVVVAVAERNLPELTGVLGLFLNLVVFRTNLAGNPTFREAVQRVRETSTRAHSHDGMPFNALARLLPQIGVLGIMFNYIGSTMELAFPSISVERVPIPGDFLQLWDLSVHLEETVNGLYCATYYKPGLFSRERMESFAELFQQLLAHSLTAPDTSIEALLGLTEPETIEVASVN